MQIYTQVIMLKCVNNTYEQMQQHEHELYDADSVYNGSVEQLYAAAYVTGTQVELDDSDACELDNEVLLFANELCTDMYDNVLQVYYVHDSGFNFYVKTEQLAQLQLMQRKTETA